MDQQENNQNNNLDDLLKRAAAGKLEDDFEKEAAEGFAMLGPEASRELKTKTDKRIASLFSTRKKQVVQWSMAAGVVLLVSMTVYFFRQDVASDETKVVQTSVTEKKEEITAPPAPTLGSQSSAVPEEKPVSTARLKRVPPPEPANRSESTLDLEQQVAGEANTENVTGEAAPPVDLASAEKATQTAPAPVVTNNAPGTAAYYSATGAGGEKEIHASSPEKGKSRAAKKTAPAETAPLSAASREARADDDGAMPEINRILNKKLGNGFNKAFTAVVLMKDGVVKDVKFSTGDLTKSDKKEIETVLRGLTTEELRSTGVSDGEIKLDYRP